jgi:WD40 repeat protein
VRKEYVFESILGKMEQTQILPPVQTTKRGERAHVHAFSSSLTKKNESQFSCTYVNEKTGKAYIVTFLGRTQKKKTTVEHQHAKITCVCPFAGPPDGDKKHKMAASGASDGSIQIWSLETGALIKRHEKVLAGPVRDVCWSFDGAKVLLAGEGREQFAKCVDAETGTAVKDLSGATKACTTVCGSRKGKPHRVITGSEDFRVRFYTGGPPFQLEQRERAKRRTHTHEKYINEVRMSRDDKYVLSAAGDGIGVWDVETLEMVGDEGRVAAKDGSTYGVAWLDDDEDEENNTIYRFVSSGADKMVKLWKVKDVVRERQVGVDVEIVEILKKTDEEGEEEDDVRLVVKPKTEQHVAKHVTLEDAYSCCGAETTVDDMQIGVCASAETVVSCGLSGKMTVLDVVEVDDKDEFGERKKKKQLRFREEILGHSRPITAMCSVDVSSGSSSSTEKKYQVWTASIRREDDPRPKILVCEYVPETKTIENVREVIKNTPLKKVTKLVNCGNDIVAAIGFDDHLRFASVKDMAFIDDDFDNSNDNNDQECHRRAVKFEQQPIDVCVVSVSVSISQDEEEEEEEEEEPLLPKTTKVTTKEVHHCELMITFANGLAKLVPIEYEKSSSSSDNNGGGGELKILFDKIQQIDVRTTIQTTTIQTTTTRRKKEVELSCGRAVQFSSGGGGEKTLFAFGCADEAAVYIFERRNEDGVVEHKQTLERSNASSSCNITCIDFAPNGKHLAVGDSNREIVLWTTTSNAEDEDEDDKDEEERKQEETKEELFFRLLKPRDRRHSKFLHSSRIEDVHWSRSSTSFLSCSLDGRAKIWRNVVRKSSSKSSAVKVVEEDVNAVRGGVRFAQLLYVNNENDENFDKENEDDLETANAHLVCVGADCAVRFFAHTPS